MNDIFPPEIINQTFENHFYVFSKFSRRIYTAIILLIVCAVASLYLIRVNISVQSSGLIRSLSEPIGITSPVVAEVLKTNITENKSIDKGDTLIWLNDKKLVERVQHLHNLILQNEKYQHDLKSLSGIKYTSFKTELYRSVYDQYMQKLAEYDLKIKRLKNTLTRTQSLFTKNVIPLTEKEEQEFQWEKAVEDKNIFIKQSKNVWQQRATEYKLATDKYKNEINELQKDFDNYVIVSPCAGHIKNFNGIQPGSFVTTGQAIAVISPDDNLISEHLVPPKDIGYLKKKMPVIFQIDAYNYNQWGLASGEIIDISNEIYLINNQPYFKVKCSLNEQYLTLKNGFKGYLKKGLTTTARFQVTKRTLAQLLFDKADHWLNPKLNN